MVLGMTILLCGIILTALITVISADKNDDLLAFMNGLLCVGFFTIFAVFAFLHIPPSGSKAAYIFTNEHKAHVWRDNNEFEYNPPEPYGDKWIVAPSE